MITPRQTKAFRTKILRLAKAHARPHLPWRTRRTPYRVLVSEVMLQQTQVARVIPKFQEFVKAVPDFQTLAKLSQKKLLTLWQGLGYNSRALRLQKAAQEVAMNHGDTLPKDKSSLVALPGIGPYTAGAIRVFAWNLPDIFIETNIRRVFIHEFFADKKNISDKEILPLIEETLPQENPRAWYEALMDYGATLPKILKSNPNTQSKHYTKQSKFSGSDRQLRGKILRLALANKKFNAKILGEKPERVKKIVAGLQKDGFEI